MQRLAEIAEAIAGTTKKLQKTALLANYLKSRPPEEAALSTIFLSGRVFPTYEEATLQVGGSLLWKLVEELSGKSSQQLTDAYRRYGDLGAVAGEVLQARPLATAALNVIEVEKRFRQVAAARGPAAKSALLRDLLGRATPLEAKYLIKIMTGDLRIGLKESLVEEAIAKAFGSTLGEVQRANMLLGDIGETLRFAAEGKLTEARMRLFHPIGFMLASPAADADEALSYFTNAAVEDKYDGIRAQAHCAGDEVRIFSRTRDDITESFPELPDALAGLPQDAILDGEIVAWSYLEGAGEELGRALPFSALQQRLGRKKVSREMIRRVPVAYLVFDVIYAGGELLIDRPLRERADILNSLLKAPRAGARARSREQQGNLLFSSEGEVTGTKVVRAPVFEASSPERLEEMFTAAQERGNEGLMIKDLESRYTPGRRGKSWLKLKRELATLDVVVTGVEWGHGKRIDVLSDYTFAVRDGDQLLNVGKAYSGLTDAEIAEMTKWFLEHTVEDQGFRREVEPKIVLEVAFNNVMRSDRHNSGYALRFPRIVRLRQDKPAEEIDTLARVKEIYESQERGKSHKKS
jgi:ATP-dependent DNA ligase